MKRSGNKKVFRVLVNHRLNTWQLDSPITSCHSWSHRCGTTVKHQMSARENMFSKYQQAVVHHISARILCTVPCMVLFIHAQGGYGQTGRGSQWRWENEQLSCERRLTAWLKPGQCLTPECVKIQHWTVLLFQSALPLPAEVLHHQPPSLFACFKYCSLSSVSACGREGDKVFRRPSTDVGNGS